MNVVGRGRARSRDEVFRPDADEDNDVNNSNKKTYDKANWTEANIYMFCGLSVEQIKAGNCPNGTM